MRPWDWADVGGRGIPRTEGRPEEDTEKRQPSARQRERPLENPVLWHRHFAFLTSQTVRKKFLQFKSPGLWYSVMTTLENKCREFVGCSGQYSTVRQGRPCGAGPICGGGAFQAKGGAKALGWEQPWGSWEGEPSHVRVVHVQILDLLRMNPFS